MIRIIVCLLLLLLLTENGWSQQQFHYENYFYYRNHQYLQTSSVLLSGAVIKAVSGDSTEALNLVRSAVLKGIYDTTFITGRSALQFIIQSKQWSEIKKIIQNNRNRYANPEEMEIRTDDINRFWSLYGQLGKKNADEKFMQNYIMQGTHGLRTFFEMRMGLKATNLISTVKQKYKYYESIKSVSLSLQNYKPQIIAAGGKLKTLYPDAIFPPTTFVIGNFSAFGTADGGGGQLIGAEFLCDLRTADTLQLNGWEKSTITDTSRILGIIVHELIHIQQRFEKPVNTLLERSISEGAADFIAHLVVGINLNHKIHTYANDREKELWEKFQKQMNGQDISEWLYNGFNEKRSYPPDLGYFMGYKICEA